MGPRGQILGVIFAPRGSFRRSVKKKWGKIEIFQKVIVPKVVGKPVLKVGATTFFRIQVKSG